MLIGKRKRLQVVESDTPMCYNNFVTVTFGGALCFYPKSRLSVCVSRDCDKRVETTGRRLFDLEAVVKVQTCSICGNPFWSMSDEETICFTCFQEQPREEGRIEVTRAVRLHPKEFVERLP